MKHKLLSILLCLAMALSLLPTAALADEMTKGTSKNPYTREEFETMTRAEYIAAQEALGGTMYVDVGDYSYGTNGVLGNGVRDDQHGGKNNANQLNYYAAPGAKSGQYSDAAVGKKIVFVNGSITSNVTGYESIDKIGTSLLLAVPAYTNVTFEGTTFNNVMSFDYQLYTSPWSQLGELKFENCTFNGIIVGAIAAQTLTFNGCEFKNYTNTTDANSSNPTWIRPAYGNWDKGDNEGQGDDFRSLTTIDFTNNTVTSTRPVKFERIAQWEMPTTVTATSNSFDISAQTKDTVKGKTKNVGLYFGANAKFDLVAENNRKEGTTAALYTAVYSAPDGTSNAGLPAGSTVKDSSGNDTKLTDALKWKGNPSNPDDVLTLKTAYTEAAVAGINGVSYVSLAAAVAAAKDGETIKLLKDVTDGDGVIVPSGKNFTLDFDNHTYTVTQKLAGSKGTESQCFQLLKNSTLTFKNGTIKAGNGNVAMIIQNYSNLTLENMLLDGTSITRNDATYTMSNNCGDVVIKDTIINTVPNGVAFDVYGGFGNYSDVTVTVTGSSEIDGKIEVARGSGTQNKNTLAINGGTINGELAVTDNEKTEITISGGSFSQPVKEEYCADGFIPKDNGNGTYGVKTGTYAAKIGDTKYESLEAAVANVAADETITLLQNVPAESVITVARTISFKVDTNKADGSGVYAFAAGTNIIKGNNTTLTKTDENGVYTYSFVYTAPSSGSGSSGYYVSTPSKTENGTVTVSPRYADKGSTVTVTVKPDSGYVLGSLTVTDSKGNELTLTDKGDGKYTFTMPSGRVEVKASFVKEIETSPFADVATDAYYYEAVKWAVGKGITTGVGDNLFAPEQPCTRAQIVTFLWRAAGSPEPKGTAAGMTDVVSGSYYEKAVAWAIENGVTTGTTATTFSPDATCTRAQAVTFLARALNAKAASAAEFSDVPADSYFANAVAWASANGVTEGVGNGLFAPDNNCTRGQIVTFLFRAYNK